MIAISVPSEEDRFLESPARLRLVRGAADVPAYGRLELASGRVRSAYSPSRRRLPSKAVYWRRRIAALLICAFLSLSAVVAVQSALGRIGGGPLATTGASGGAQRAAAESWVVRPGDTLWSIARAIDSSGDIRPLVDKLAAEVGPAPIYPGEVIPIPNRTR